jgi:DNA end-binding protein Ku
MARPYWSGQIRISLVAFGVKFFTATEAKGEIRFHQLSRKTGERVRHQKVSGEEGPVDNSDIVKGYEYSKGQYIEIEPKDIENLRIPSRQTLDVTQFVDQADIDASYFEKPYFVVPENDAQSEAFAVVREALLKTKKIALGKIAFGGREHLVAIAPPADEKLAGMMAYTMRYAEELRKPGEYFADIKTPSIDSDQLSLAEELIKRKSAKFAPEKFTDEYEAALRAMVEAKLKNLPMPREEAPQQSAKVINLMDALRKSVQADEPSTPKKAPARAGAKSTSSQKKGIELVKTGTGKSRKSA